MQMEYMHEVRYWNGKYIEVRNSKSTHYYSMGAYQPDDYDIDETETETLYDLYKLWEEAKADDKACGEKWCYRFYAHNIKREINPINGKLEWVDYATEGKIYKRGLKVFFKPI